MYEAGFQHWRSLFDTAVTRPLEASLVGMEHSFSHHPFFIPQMEIDRSSSNKLTSSGTSKWEVADGTCDLAPLSKKMYWRLTCSSPTIVCLRPDHVASYQSFLSNHGSHLPILTLAWAYVLSARWAEIIPDASMQYTDSVAMASSQHVSEGGSTCYVGNATPECIRWWSAVLAPGAGWSAFIPHSGRNLESPWAVCLQSANINICFDSDDAFSLQRHTPVSSTTATYYILEYVGRHGVLDQSYAAFAAALLLPTRRAMSRSILWPALLPMPRAKDVCQLP